MYSERKSSPRRKSAEPPGSKLGKKIESRRGPYLSGAKTTMAPASVAIARIIPTRWWGPILKARKTRTTIIAMNAPREYESTTAATMTAAPAAYRNLAITPFVPNKSAIVIGRIVTTCNAISFVLPKMPLPLPVTRYPSGPSRPWRYSFIADALSHRLETSARNKSPRKRVLVRTTFTSTTNITMHRMNVPLNSCQASDRLMAKGIESKPARQ